MPPWLATKPQLVLQLGLNFAIPIPDLEVDDDGVRCTLSFNRTPYHCALPWSAVYALVAEDGQVTVWPTEIPQELVPEQATVRKNPPTSALAAPQGRRPSPGCPSCRRRASATERLGDAPRRHRARNRWSERPGRTARRAATTRSRCSRRSPKTVTIASPRGAPCRRTSAW